jgi:tight adherence protein B
MPSLPALPHDAISVFAAIAAFGLVLSLWLIGVVLWTSRRKRRAAQFQQRLDYASAAAPRGGGAGRVLRLWHDGQEAVTWVPGVTPDGILVRLERIRIAAGVEAPLVTALPMLAGTLVLIIGASYLVTSNLGIAVLCAVAAVVVLWIYLSRKIAKRHSTFERQLIDALELASRSLRAGHPLIGSFRLIAEEIAAPMGNLFGEVCQQQAMGVPMEQALRGVADENASEDLKLFVTSVVIQLASGGNLADMMERLANVIRDRQRLNRRVRVLTAQTQFSKRVLLALPFLVFVALNLINPQYMRPLYTTTLGQLIMVVAGTGLVLGWITMNWLSKLSY